MSEKYFSDIFLLRVRETVSLTFSFACQKNISLTFPCLNYEEKMMEGAEWLIADVFQRFSPQARGFESRPSISNLSLLSWNATQ